MKVHDIAIEMYDMATRIEQELGAGLHGGQIRELADKLLVINHIQERKLNDFDARD